MIREGNQGRALVLAPHPDDEAFGCGGMIHRMTSSGALVDVAFLTRGELGNEEGLSCGRWQAELVRRRTAEAQAACKILGAASVVFLDGNDGRLRAQPHLVRDVLRLLQGKPYRTVFCPWGGESHPDHVATYGFLMAALAEYRSVRFPSSRYAEAYFVCEGRELRDARVCPDRLPPGKLDKIEYR